MGIQALCKCGGILDRPIELVGHQAIAECKNCRIEKLQARCHELEKLFQKSAATTTKCNLRIAQLEALVAELQGLEPEDPK